MPKRPNLGSLMPVSPVIRIIAPAAEMQAALLLTQVCPVFLILAADEFEYVAGGDQIQLRLNGEGPRVVFRIFHRHFQIDVTEVATAISLTDAHGFAARMAEQIDPAGFIKANGFDGQGVALPFAHRVSHPGRLWIVGKATPVGVNLSRGVAVLG